VLAERPEDGKIIVERDEKGQVSGMKYLSLNPTSCLKRIMDQVKSLILISGTLEPS
jgi:Rad3-related DNA helicase